MNKFGISVGSFVLLVFSISSAQACSCVKYQSIDEHIDSYEVIFLGESTGTQRDVDDYDRTTLGRKTEFVVIDVLKGDKSEKVDVFHTKNTGGNCGINFFDGAKYLVFANRDNEGRLQTSFCSGTRQEVGSREWSLIEYAVAAKKK